MFDFGSSLGTTSVPSGSGSCGSDPEQCFAGPLISKGTFALAPGPHSLTINVLAGSLSSGAAYFQVIEGGIPCDGNRHDLETPNFVLITRAEGAGRGIGFCANETFKAESVGISGALQYKSFNVVIHSSSDGHTAGDVLYSGSGFTVGTGFDWNDVAVFFTFFESNCYVVNWRPSTDSPNDWATGAGIYYQADSGLPFTTGPITIVEGFEGINPPNPIESVHPRLRFCSKACDYCFNSVGGGNAQWCLDVRNEDESGNVWMDGKVLLGGIDERPVVGTYYFDNAALSLTGDVAKGGTGIPFNLNIFEGSLVFNHSSEPGGHQPNS